MVAVIDLLTLWMAPCVTPSPISRRTFPGKPAAPTTKSYNKMLHHTKFKADSLPPPLNFRYDDDISLCLRYSIVSYKKNRVIVKRLCHHLHLESNHCVSSETPHMQFSMIDLGLLYSKPWYLYHRNSQSLEAVRSEFRMFWSFWNSTRVLLDLVNPWANAWTVLEQYKLISN